MSHEYSYFFWRTHQGFLHGLIVFLAALVLASEAGAGVRFSSFRNFAAGRQPRSIAVADLDGDSVPDLVTGNYFSEEVSVLLGDGDGNFQAAGSFARSAPGCCPAWWPTWVCSTPRIMRLWVA